MNYKNYDVAELRKHITHHLEYITCINCCKYYIVPTTATCGHSLCHICWRSHRSCPSCLLKLDKKALRLNSPLQTLTEHGILLGNVFKSLYKINLDLTQDTDEQKHVKEWLANSENQFSAPVTSSQQVSETSIKSMPQITSDIEIHTKNVKVKEPERERIQMNFKQVDWDRIEEMPEIETNQILENPADPMNIDNIDIAINNKEYNTRNPRRSSRHKELLTSNPITNDISSDKESGKSFNINSDKKSKKLGHNWKNVKRMKKEFSKLNKKNNNKLNISIEMCKKTKHSANKAPLTTHQIAYNMDDNTPEIAATNEALIKNTNSNNDNQINMEKNTDIPKDLQLSALNTNNILNKVHSDITIGAHIHDINQKRLVLQNKSNENIEHVKTSKVNFFKRGPLETSFTDTSVINANRNITNNNTVSVGTDDVEITIKIGKTLTNICIQKKENDVKININSDREIQTSLRNFNMENVHSSSVKDLNAQPIDNGYNVKKYNDAPVCTSQYSTSKVQIEKSLSTKKNTKSADTVSAHFEITESEEKEFEDQMESLVVNKDKNKAQKLSKLDCNLHSKSKVQLSLKNMDAIPEDVEFLNDLDIFDGESVKEGNIQSLKSTVNTPSVVLMPTGKNMSRSQKKTNKRDRDSCDVENLSNNKKIKISEEIKKKHITQQAVIKENIDDVESENINYDAIMSQVFANINADMKSLDKTGTQISNTQKSYIKNFPQSIKQDDINKRMSEETNQKCSENVFSLLEKENCNSELFITTSQKNLKDNSLVAGRAPNIDMAMENKEKVASQTIVDLVDFGTPIQDDDDKSVVEETPQKNTSLLKSKHKNDTQTLPDDSAAALCRLTEKSKSLNETGSRQNYMDMEDSMNVISIIDSVQEITEVRKTALETPLTITKFVDKITHKSTPLARKALNFNSRNDGNDPEETLCPSFVEAAKTTQEREFLSKAFENTLESPIILNVGRQRGRTTELCVAGSCLTISEQGMLKQLCLQRNWTFHDKFTNDLTHLVVGVDEENRSQRSVKYICTLASAKWIVTFAWVEKCLQVNGFIDEEPFEALDASGEPGPRRSRLAKHKLLQGFTFYCMPPFTIIDSKTLKDILEVSGARVVNSARDARVTDAPTMLLAEPEQTQEDRFTYLAMELQIVPMNYEWVLNCLGTYTLKPICDLLLCPTALLPPATSNWPAELILPYCDE